MRFHRGRSDPEIVVERRGRWRDRENKRRYAVPQPKVAARHGDRDGVNPAQAAVPGQFAGEAKTRIRSLLRAGLQHAAGTADGLADRPPLRDGARERLLAVHVEARLHRGDGHRCVPVFRRGDRDRIQIRPRKHLADVLRDGALGGDAALGGGRVARGPSPREVRIADRNDPHLRESRQLDEMAAPTLARADHRHAEALAGRRRSTSENARGHDERHGARDQRPKGLPPDQPSVHRSDLPTGGRSKIP